MLQKLIPKIMNANFSSSVGALSNRHLIAVCQLNSKYDLDENWRVCADMVTRAKARGSEMIFFPECFDYIARSKEETIKMSMEESSEFIGRFRQLAKEHRVWLSLGGFHHKVVDSELLPFNTHLIINDCGETKGSYHKLHLFDLDIPGTMRLMESEFSRAGDALVPPIDTPVGQLGLSICYDVRFPELSLWNRYKGAQLLSFPSSFTINTGLAHWEALLRARAIETQCYVVAAGQTGKHNEKRSSYGHSMVVDPWGAVVAQCSDTVDICYAEINLDYLEEVRKLQPIISHRRSDLYSLIFNTHVKDEEIEDQKFGEIDITKEFIFYQSELSYAFVNLKPILPGHVLCSTKRLTRRLRDVTDQETSDLFRTAKRVQAMLEKHYKAKSSTITVQDGADAGQTVAHTHVHVIPRVAGDMDSDQLSAELCGHEERRTARPSAEMMAEAKEYRSLMKLHCSTSS